jgi:dynein heavy chain
MFLLFQNVDDLTETYDNIVGDVLLSASVVAYLGPFILDYRQALVAASRVHPFL